MSAGRGRSVGAGSHNCGQPHGWHGQVAGRPLPHAALAPATSNVVGTTQQGPPGRAHAPPDDPHPHPHARRLLDASERVLGLDKDTILRQYGRSMILQTQRTVRRARAPMRGDAG